MGAYVADFDPRGGRSEGVVSLLQGGSPVGVDIQGGDVDPDPQDGADPEYLSAQGRATSHQDTAKEAGGWELVLSSSGCVNGRSGL